MTSKLLLPQRFRIIGLLLLIPSLILGLLYRFRDYSIEALSLNRSTKLVEEDGFNLNEKVNLTDEMALTGIILSLVFIAFARQKHEDEFIHHNRLQSWQWAVIVNYVLLLIATWFVHGLGYLDVMMYNMLTVLIIFIVRFHFINFKNNRAAA
ncbi:MAG: hypothetical protein H7Y31_00725 [Chitinophagaceae bacterium]|nr:hypothetical protein [Chitinophagaceae bacterium]